MGPGTRFHYVTNDVIVDATYTIVNSAHGDLVDKIMESLDQHIPISHAHGVLVAYITEIMTHSAPAHAGQPQLGGMSRRIRKTRKTRGKRR